MSFHQKNALMQSNSVWAQRVRPTYDDEDYFAQTRDQCSYLSSDQTTYYHNPSYSSTPITFEVQEQEEEEFDDVYEKLDDFGLEENEETAEAYIDYEALVQEEPKTIPEEWHKLICQIVHRLPPGNIRLLLARVCLHDSIPRKQQQFLNFLRSSCHLHDNNIGVMVWTKVQEELDKMRHEGHRVSDLLFAKKKRHYPALSRGTRPFSSPATSANSIRIQQPGRAPKLIKSFEKYTI